MSVFKNLNEGFNKKYIKETLDETITNEVKDILNKNGYNTDVEGASNYIEAAVEYIEMNHDFGYEYPVEQWFEETVRNYPEDLEFMKECLKEDIIKQDNKWVNKGDSGKTHGKFKTKKEADAQRKAMFANGFTESLQDEDGWGEQVLDILYDAFEHTEHFMYEIRNCVRDSYAGFGSTIDDLIDEVNYIADMFTTAAEEFENSKQELNEGRRLSDKTLKNKLEFKTNFNESYKFIKLREESNRRLRSGYANNIDKDLIKGADNLDRSNLITDINTKCSTSAINNLIYLLESGKRCELCLGSMVTPDGRISTNITHVWVTTNDGSIYETHNFNDLRLKARKCIKFLPSDLDNLKSILQRELYN